MLHRMLNRIGVLFAGRRRARIDAADLRYLDSMSNERLARDLGLHRSESRGYHPY